MATTAYRTEVTEELDGTRTVYEYMECQEAPLLAFFREVFDSHWKQIVFGPCIHGAVFEIRLTSPPKEITLLDGFLTIDVGAWHFHLCLGMHRGTQANPTATDLATVRRASKAGFFRTIGDTCLGGSWGFRMWNGVGEQMITIFFPNPYLDDRFKPQKPDWSRLALWNEMRFKYLPGATVWLPSETGVQPQTAVH